MLEEGVSRYSSSAVEVSVVSAAILAFLADCPVRFCVELPEFSDATIFVLTAVGGGEQKMR
jgi:hypothetical protein